MKKILIILLISLNISFNSCSTIGGLSGINLLSSAQENQLGAQTFEKYKKSLPISRNSRYNSQLQRVSRNLLRASNLQMSNPEFVVFVDKSPNAFALPGGKIGVHTGLFKLTRNDAGLAAVVGHELAHVKLRHNGKSASQKILLGLGDAIMQSRGVGSIARMGVKGGADLLLLKPHSRKAELEADRVGMIHMAKAGYNPREAINLWKRFASYKQQKGGNSMAFLSTHPVDSVRIVELQKYLPQAMQTYNNRNSNKVYQKPINHNSFAPTYFKAKKY